MATKPLNAKTFPPLIHEDFSSASNCVGTSKQTLFHQIIFPLSHQSAVMKKKKKATSVFLAENKEEKKAARRVTTWKEFEANRTAWYACSLLMTSVGQNDCRSVTDAM